MFCKGSITYYDYNMRKGTIFLTDINKEVEFFAEDLLPMMVDPQIGDNVSCFFIEKNTIKQAKFIARLEQENAYNESMKDESISASRFNFQFEHHKTADLITENLKDDLLSFDLSSVDLKVKDSNRILDPVLLDGINKNEPKGFDSSQKNTRFELGDSLFTVIDQIEVDVAHLSTLDKSELIVDAESHHKSISVLKNLNETNCDIHSIKSNDFEHLEDTDTIYSIEKYRTKLQNNEKFESTQQELLRQERNDFQIDRSESTLGNVTTSLFYKKKKRQQFKKIKKDKMQLNRSVFIIVIVVLVIAILLTLGYRKLQTYQVEQNAKAQLYLIEHQRIIEEQRSKLGKLPDKILTDETLDELLGKDHHKFLNNMVNQSIQPQSSSLNKMSQQQNATRQYSCDGRIYCSQMRSYQEAVFFQNNCPNTQMDGDGDGVPCERQFGR